jgi:type VI secretion system ImpM family protein
MTPGIGLYGKLPAVGDFVGRGFSHELREGLDRLLQSALMAALQDGANAHELFAQAPPFMLSVRPGVLCASGFVGGIVPSQDRVGRVFPLCVGLETPAHTARLPLPWPAQGLAQGLCGLAIRAQAAGASADQLFAELPDAARWQALAAQGLPFSSADDDTVPRVAAEEPAACFEGPESRMSLPERALCSRSPWTAQALGAVLSPSGAFERYFVLGRLQDASLLAAVFDGHWARWGWAVHGPRPEPAPAVFEPVPVPVEPVAARMAPADDEDATRPPAPRIDKAQPLADISPVHAPAAGLAAAAPPVGDAAPSEPVAP